MENHFQVPSKRTLNCKVQSLNICPYGVVSPLLCSLSGLHGTGLDSMNIGTQNWQLFCLSRAVSMPKVIYFAINRFSNLELSRSALQIPSFFRTQFLQRRHRYMLWFWGLIFFDKAGCTSLQIGPVLLYLQAFQKPK